jgi:hypothetical protein
MGQVHNPTAFRIVFCGVAPSHKHNKCIERLSINFTPLKSALMSVLKQCSRDETGLGNPTVSVEVTGFFHSELLVSHMTALGIHLKNEVVGLNRHIGLNIKNRRRERDSSACQYVTDCVSHKILKVLVDSLVLRLQTLGVWRTSAVECREA